MRYSVCVIDNDIPTTEAVGVEDTELLNASNLRLLLQQRDELWTDGAVKSLIQDLLDDKNNDTSPRWEVYGFTHPSIYLNALDKSLFRSDFIVFDWDYPVADSDSRKMLKEILEKTFCLIFIYSKSDTEEEIMDVMQEPAFKEYEGRLFSLSKDTENPTAVLLKRAEECLQNFSFQFASDLRKRTVQIMDRTLSELGRATLSDMKNYLKLEDGATNRGLVDFIAGRLHSGLLISKIPAILKTEQQEVAPVNDKLVKEIWSYRLYLPHDPDDDIVRCGDIVKLSDKLFLVVSGNCDLRFFWSKNFGSINLLPLHYIENSNTELKEVLTFCVSPAKLKGRKIKHLLDNIGEISDGPFVLPFIKNCEKYENFIAMPKEFLGKKIVAHESIVALSKDSRKNACLKYGVWNGSEKVCSVSEPFLTAIIQHTFRTIGGFGVPDYPDAMEKIFTDILDDFINAPAVNLRAALPIDQAPTQ